MSYEQKLMAMKKMLTKASPVKEEKPKERTIPNPPAYEANWLQEGFVKEENQFGIVYKKVIQYDANYFHGNKKLGDLKKALSAWNQYSQFHPLAPQNETKLVFFDTETTGLKGAGTLIFLLGFMEETKNGFQLTQYVLPGPDHEAAFLYASNFWKEQMTLVTYNGKSFDMPQVETRWTMNRNDLPALKSHHHIDLLHGARRVWKAELDTFKLTAIEESQLHFHREGDIPGHLAPIIYQDAVKSGDAKTLMKVLKHNEWDILSLVALYIRATNLILDAKTPETAISHTNIGKWFTDLKNDEEGAVFFEQVIHKYGTNHPMTHYHYAFILKRNGAYEKALQSFQVAANQLIDRERMIALEEIAKLYEHKLKNIQDALITTRKGLVLVAADETLTRKFRIRMKRELLHRETRLTEKLMRKHKEK